MKCNNKGFSSLEILVIILLLALFFIIGKLLLGVIVNASDKKSFKNEAAQVVKLVDNAYLDKKKNTEIRVSENNNVVNDGSIYKLNINGNEYNYFCITMNELRSNGNSDDKISDNINGYIQMFVGNDEKNTALTYINLEKDNFYIKGNLNDIMMDNYKVLDNKSNDKGLTCPLMVSLPN